MGFRFTLLIIFISGAYLFLVFHLFELQLSSGQRVVARGASQTASWYLPARGAIFFTDKAGSRVPVAADKDFPVVYAVPKAVESSRGTAAKLAPILNEPEDALAAKLAAASSWEPLAKKVSDETAAAVDRLALKGVYVEPEPFRYYPLGDFASQVIGFVGFDDTGGAAQGKYGLEKMYNSVLAGTPDPAGGAATTTATAEDVTTTLDPNIQIEAENLLASLLKEHSAPAGTIIVEEAATGKILALANSPSFDPNSYEDAPLAAFLNPAVQALYEPGSVFKIITMAAGIDAGKITPDTTYRDTGSVVVSGKTIKNWDSKAHGVMTMTNVIERSLNTGAVFAEKRTGDDVFTSYVRRFGFGAATGIDLPGELSGRLGNIAEKHPPAIAFASASFGQGIAVTPVQMINAFAAIANGGTLMRPYVNAALPPRALRRVVSSDTAATITAMMVSAVDKNIIAKVSGYAVAGKTGTAQVADPVNGGYIPDEYINTFIGFAPASAPRFVILVRLEKPTGAALAGATVVPTFQQLTQFLVNYYGVPPDRIENSP